MGMNYYLGCPKHQKRVPFWARHCGMLFGPDSTSDEHSAMLTEFLLLHCECGIDVFTEHDGQYEAYDPFVSNVEADVRRSRNVRPEVGQ